MFILNWVFFNAFKVYVTLNGQKMFYKKFLHSVAIQWIHDNVLENDPVEDIQSVPSNIILGQRIPKYDPPGRYDPQEISRNTRLQK